MLRLPYFLLATTLALAACHRGSAAAPGLASPDLVAAVVADSGEVRPVGGRVIPAYPPEMQVAREEAVLVAVFPIDAAGRVATGSVRFLLDAPKAFRSAACQALRSARFQPVVRNGSPRPAVVVQDFLWALDGGRLKWPTDRPDTEAVRQAIRANGAAAGMAQLRERPGCT